MKDVNPTEEIFREFDRLRSSNREIIMFISVLAKMITKVNTHASSTDRINQTKDHKITQVLVDLQDREDFKMYKDQEIMNQYVRLHKLLIFHLPPSPNISNSFPRKPRS